MVDESKGLEQVSSDADDNEVASVNMNQRNLPWDQNSRPNSSLYSLLPREDLLDDEAHRQLPPLPPHQSFYASSDYGDIFAATLGVASVVEQTPASFLSENRRLDEEKADRQQQHRVKRRRWTSDPSLSPPRERFHYENEFDVNYTSEDENAKESSAREHVEAHYPLSEGVSYAPPPQLGYPSSYPYASHPQYHHSVPASYYGYPPPQGTHYSYGEAPPSAASSPRHYPSDYAAAAAPTDWRAGYVDPSHQAIPTHEGDPLQTHATMPPPPSQHHLPPRDMASRMAAHRQAQPLSHVAAHTGERTSQIPAGPSDAERREAGNNRAEQALEKWYAMLQELYNYKTQHGDCRVPQKYPEQPALGVWVNKQRMEFKPYLEDETREMTLIISEKLRHLKDVGFEWAKPKGDQLWSEKYEELQQYRYYEGHCNVPTKYTKNPTLGRWVSTQRAQHKDFLEGKKTPMTQERIDKLNELGFVWSMMK